MSWRETLHPRAPRGHQFGGRFIRSARRAAGVRPDPRERAESMLVRQDNKNSCGIASIMAVADYYGLKLPYENSSEWHYKITDGVDRALYPWELEPLLEDIGIETEYSGKRGDLKAALAGEYPMIWLAEEKEHYVTVWNGLVIDSLNGIKEVTLGEFLREYSPGGGLKITKAPDRKTQLRSKVGKGDIP